jgi:hypothetical protein
MVKVGWISLLIMVQYDHVIIKLVVMVLLGEVKRTCFPLNLGSEVFFSVCFPLVVVNWCIHQLCEE